MPVPEPSPAAPAPPQGPAADVSAQHRETPDRDKGSSKRTMVLAIIGFAVLLAIAAAWRFSPLHEVADTEAIADWLHGMRRNPWAPLIIVMVYVAANAVFFPNTVLNAATILGMGTAWGLPCALAGSLASAMVTYTLGRRFGRRRLSRIDSAAIDRITQLLKRSGVLGIATLRLLPVAPYGVVNLVAGAAHVRAVPFAFGTLLGLLPGNLLMTAFGHQLRQVLRNPSKSQIAIMVGVLLVAAAGALWARSKALAS